MFQTDGGLNAPLVPTAKRTLVLGTAAKGPAGVAYQLTQRSQAAQRDHTVRSSAVGIDQVRSSGGKQQARARLARSRWQCSSSLPMASSGTVYGDRGRSSRGSS